MSKVAVVFWSGTGNTAAMADAVAEGIKGKGGEAVLIGPEKFNAGEVANYDAIAFGCPSMGTEELEENDYAPMFSAVEGSLSGKKIALFGSYGWGDGQWMRDWESRCKNAGANLACDFVICQEAPDDAAKDACKALGAALA